MGVGFREEDRRGTGESQTDRFCRDFHCKGNRKTGMYLAEEVGPQGGLVDFGFEMGK